MNGVALVVGGGEAGEPEVPAGEILLLKLPDMIGNITDVYFI